jgi:predicted NBD/HSP70 family sugar kinase
VAARTTAVTTSWVVVGLDNGATSNNATVLDATGRFLVTELVETPSRVTEGPDPALDALENSFQQVLTVAGVGRHQVRAVGLDSPGPASSDGVISRHGSTNFGNPSWRSFDLRGNLERRLGLQVIYHNDGNAAALYAHQRHFGRHGKDRSSVSVIVGTGLGGGLVREGRVIRGATGTAGELGHVYVPMDGLVERDQPVPTCNCGFTGDAESVASLTGIERNLLPYWLTRYPNHELAAEPSLAKAARQIRSYAEAGDEMAIRIFDQQAKAIGRLFTIVANVLDPDAYFVGGGVVETAPAFREWFLGNVRQNVELRLEAAEVATFALVPDLDMAGARGSALAALDGVRQQ